MGNLKQAINYINNLYRDTHRNYNLNAFPHYYAKQATWHTNEISFGYDEMYHHFAEQNKSKKQIKTVIHDIVPSDQRIIAWVTHNHFNEQNEKLLAVNTMVNLTLDSDLITRVDFMWDAPVSLIMPSLSGCLTTPSLPIEELLSAKEMQCFLYIVQGLSARQIAEKLHRSPRTIEVHFNSIKEKLNLNKITECIAYAHEQGLLHFAPVIKIKEEVHLSRL